MHPPSHETPSGAPAYVEDPSVHPKSPPPSAPLEEASAAKSSNGNGAPKTPTQPLRLNKKEQWETLTSPVRFDIIELLSNYGPCSVNDLAWQLGRNSDSLYYHVRKLAATEMIIVAGERVLSGQNTETLYRLNGTHVVVDDLANPEARPYITRLLSAVLRMTDRETRQALEGDDTRLSHTGPRRNFSARRDLVWLNDDQLHDVNEHLDAIQAIFKKARAERTGRLYSATTFLAPLVRATDPQGRPLD
ncbi:MAG: winged helix-turn-helix domain-containing protein [Planctomycetota bacterium]